MANREKAMPFEPIKTRKGFRGSLLDLMLSRSYEPNQPVGNFAKNDVQDSVKAWLVGLDSEVAPVLPRALGWLDRAIAANEDFGTSHAFHRLTLSWARALGIWMHDGRSDTEAWEAVRRCSQAAVIAGDSFPKNEIATARLDDEMAFCFLAESYEVGIVEFEKHWGAKSISLKKNLTPRELGYALCLHKARGEFEEASLFEAGRKMLRARLDNGWLGRGQSIRAATWLEAVYELHQPRLTPLQTILRAYDDMPQVARPELWPN